MQRENVERNFGFLVHDIARLMRVNYDRRVKRFGLTRSAGSTVASNAGWMDVPDADADGNLADERSVTVPDLDNGRQYAFEVRAVNSAAVDGRAARAVATPVRAPLPPGSGFLAGNFGQPADRWAQIFNTHDIVGVFTTGARGADLHSIDFRLFTRRPNIGVLPIPSVTLYRASATDNRVTRGARVATLTVAPGSPLPAEVNTARTVAFTAPSGTRLDAGATYLVVLEHTSYVRVESTTYPAEDAGGAPGWAVDGIGAGNNSPWSYRTTASLLMRVNGTAVATAPEAPASLGAAGGDARVTLSWTPPASDGGAGIEKYQYRYSAGSRVRPGTAWVDVPDGSDTGTSLADERSLGVTELDNGRPYAFELRAVNGVRGGAAATARATPAGASESGFLASNFGRPTDGSAKITRHRDIVGTFTTGAGGAALGSIAFRLHSRLPGIAQLPSVALYRASVANSKATLGTAVTTLTAAPGTPRPTATARTIAFTAPGGTRLEAGATYMVVLENSNYVRVGYTNSSAEDDGGAPGWTIDGAGGGRSSPYSYEPSYSLLMRVNGPAAATSANQTQAEAPTVEGGPVLGEAGADGFWTAGETVDVRVAFSESVTVDTGAGTPSIGLLLGGAQPRSAAYVRGSGTAELVFGYTLAEGPHSAMLVPGDSLALNGGAIVSTADNSVAADLAHNGTAKTAVPEPASVRGTRGVANGPTASFSDVPATHDGETPFTVKLSFDEEPALSYKTVEDSLLEVSCATVSCGTVTKASRVTQGSDSEWKVTVEPSQGYDITLRLPVRACGKTGAVCVDGRPLAQAASATIPGEALTATLTGPAEHDGSESFTVRLTFSMEPEVSYKTVSDTMFTVTGGTITGAKRVKAPHDLEFDITVEPGGYEAVSLKLASPLPACGTAGAVCTAAGRKIEGTVSATIPGPVALSVADATVREGPGAKLAFVVSLDRARDAAVTVDYATGDGEAKAGSDYVAASGTLTFSANETSKTVEVEVLDDDIDEGSETLTLTNPSPSDYVKIADGEATGTIENTGHIPQAWIARFGRTVADQVLDAVDTRLRAARTAGASVSLAGQRIGGTAPPAASQAIGQANGASGANAAGAPGGTAGPGSKPASVLGAAADVEETARLRTLSDWLSGETAEDDRSRTLTGPQVLMGSSFSVAAETDGGGFAALWGRMAQSRFAGREKSLSLDGDVTTGLLGADYASGRWTTGLVISHSIGEGGYQASSRSERNVQASSRSERNVQASSRSERNVQASSRSERNVQASSRSERNVQASSRSERNVQASSRSERNVQASSRSERNVQASSRSERNVQASSRSERNVQASSRSERNVQASSRSERNVQASSRSERNVQASSRSERNVQASSRSERNVQASSRSERNRGESSGEIEATVTALTPWAGYTVTERLSVWGAAGYGAGGLTLTPEGEPALQTDLGMTLAAAGARGTLVGGDGPTLDAVTDARWVRTTTARVTSGSSEGGNLASASAEVTRLRLGLEGSWRLALGEGVLGDGATLTPRLALGVRHDGGDAETGFGADLGGGLTLAAPAQGLTLSLEGRGVLTHEASGLRDRGIAGTLAWDPPPSSGRGPKLTLSQTIGAGSSGGKEALLSRATLEGLAANDAGAGRRRLEARFGYGFAVHGGGFTMTPEIGLGLSDAGRDYRLGWRLTRGGPGSLELSIDARRRESANDDVAPEHRIGLRLGARW